MGGWIREIQQSASLENLGNLSLIPYVILAVVIVCFCLSKVNKLVKVLVTIVCILFAMVYLGIIPLGLFQGV